MNVKKLTTMAMLTAISMIVFLIEAQIPLPFAVPGVKLGIANVITLYAIWTLGWKEAGAILIIRVFLGNIIAGNVMAMAYSLAGGLLCWIVMSLLKPVMERKHIWVMSVLGAVAHNVGQLGIAIVISGTTAIAWYGPVLLVSGVITGAVIGKLTEILLDHMDKLKPGHVV